ncbi:MAG: TraR/DksA C4-type zinc finger protein [Alphaproteobacteria bacterium]|nr:TraR/DksA C4-type zinc finger protein [Alphaproteobacteria bacterium]
MKPQLVHSKKTARVALTDADRQRAYDQCGREISELSEAIETQRRHLEGLMFESSEEGDQSYIFEQRQVTLAELNRMGQRYKVLKRALDKDPHDLGSCNCCGIDIPPARLELDPATDSCVDCKELEEKRELASHGGIGLAM